MHLKKNSDPRMTFRRHKGSFETLLTSFIRGKKSGSDLDLWEVIRYSLQNGGKRVRPILCKVIVESLGGSSVDYSQLSVEFFHTASLIADDMPCMDNDDFRRGSLSSHKKFGEAKALLASYALISWGYEAVNLAARRFTEATGDVKRGYETLSIALERVSFLAGLDGAVSGQHLDLFGHPETMDDFRDIIYKKTATLFSLSFEMGWIFGGGDLSKLESVEKMAIHFGTFFQMVDDFQDRGREEEKSNIVRFLGLKQAKEEIFFHKNAFLQSTKKLGIECPEFAFIIDYIEKKSDLANASFF
ncbi:geranyl transferase [Candidatus Aerophobetes bacterium]|uniref:Geranyl transferase n=1 Tax=Aerophobetes bacterium TaxID=2030807 RepID=A0A2A4X2N5_UNCAE|nr:MAG: geranyl transferase [Candidatus Aerophobetes bacterium]